MPGQKKIEEAGDETTEGHVVRRMVGEAETVANEVGAAPTDDGEAEGHAVRRH